MLVKEIGEFGLIERISRFLPPSPSDVIVGIGDDVAVLKTSGHDYLLATCDIQVEGVHFLLDSITPYQLGRKTIAINVSDIAAMGGNPLWALVSLAIPEDTEVGWIDDLYRGMQDQADLAKASIVGGNLSRMEARAVIDIALMGRISPNHLIQRNGARPGDTVLVTGFPGESRAGLELIRRPGLRVRDQIREKLLERHLTPQPRLLEGQLLARSGLVHAMVDVSDGLLADLAHICKASGKGAEIEADALPISEAVSEMAGAAGTDLLDWVIAGGEDYELLFTAGADVVSRIKRMLLDETGTECTEIGRITEEPGTIRLRRDKGQEITRPFGGWDHFGKKDGE